MTESYLLLRRLEHRTQFATGLQTHALPRDPELLGRIARSLGYADEGVLARELASVRARVSRRFASLGREAPMNTLLARLWAALDDLDETAVAAAAIGRFGAAASTDLPRHLIALARPADRPLGATTRDRDPAFARRLVDGLADAADPEQAARLLASFFAHLTTPGVYVRALVEEPRLVRALCSLLGASTFLGEAIIAHPELVDRVVYARGVPTPDVAQAQVAEEVAALTREEATDVDAFVGALRRTKRRVTFEAGLADLSGEIGTREVALVLTALADATLEHACRFAMCERGLDPSHGLALVAVGKLGGRNRLRLRPRPSLRVRLPRRRRARALREDGQRVRLRGHAARRRARIRARHAPPSFRRKWPAGRLARGIRPLPGGGCGAWEHQALVKARVCAGDRQLGARVIEVACAAAYESELPPPERMHHLRLRMERELGHERPPARYDLKVGRGGLVDVEFAIQCAADEVRQRHVCSDHGNRDCSGRARSERLSESDRRRPVREGWRFLRRLEQRLRIAHGTGAT